MKISTTIPHEDCDGGGCLDGIVRGEMADIVCNECGILIRTVPADQLTRTLAEIELEEDVAIATCPNCGAVNLFPGFAMIDAFVCSECGKGVSK